MLVNIYLGNHDALGASSLEDQCLAFQGALRELGHDTFMTCALMPAPIVNLVFDNFVGQHMATISGALATSRIGVICTERFEGSVVNIPGFAAERARNLLEIARRATFVWCLDPVAVQRLRAELPGRPVFHIPIGYVKDLENIESLPSPRKIWDVCFTGSMTPYRHQVLVDLMQRGVSVIGDFFPTIVRRSIMARSRLQITLKHDPGRFMPSQMRIAYCLANGFPVLSDFGGVTPESPIEGFCINVRREELADRCLDLLRNPAAAAAAQERVAQFKATYRMAPLIADVVRQSFGPV